MSAATTIDTQDKQDHQEIGLEQKFGPTASIASSFWDQPSGTGYDSLGAAAIEDEDEEEDEDEDFDEDDDEPDDDDLEDDLDEDEDEDELEYEDDIDDDEDDDEDEEEE